MLIRKGTIVEMPIYASHLDGDFFADPYTFRPERFLDQSNDSILPHTYRPFGGS